MTVGCCGRRQLMHQLHCWTICQRLRQVKIEGFVRDFILHKTQA